MSSEFPIVTMKWIPPDSTTVQRQKHAHYGAEMVNRLYEDLAAQLSIPFRLICITDDYSGLNENIETAPIPERLLGMQDAWPKVYLYSADMKSIAGPRFAYLDMDVIVTGDLAALLQMEDELVVARFASQAEIEHMIKRYENEVRKQNDGFKTLKKPVYSSSFRNGLKFCNTCFYVMDSGAASFVWDEFPLELGQYKHNERPDWLKIYKGCDGGWASYMMHRNFVDGDITTVGPDDGVYEFKRLHYEPLPTDAKLVAFGGQDHPYRVETRERGKWIKEYRDDG